MTSRERLNAILNHNAADQLCVDLGAGGQTGIGVCALHQLRLAVLGRSSEPVKVIEPYQMLGEVGDDLRQALGLDVLGVNTPSTLFGFPNEGWKPFQMPDGTPCLVPDKFNWTRDSSGAFLLYPQGDTTVPPCAKMPPTSYFFDALNRQLPFEEDQLDPSDNYEDFATLSDSEVDYYVKAVDQAYINSDYGIYVTLPGMGFGDIACVPGTWLKHPRGIRDVEEWYISTVARQDYVRKVFEFQCEIALQNIERLAPVLGNKVQVVFIGGTDFGHQSGQFCSVQTYRDLYKPFHKAVNDRIHALTSWKTFVHTCGAVYPLISEFIDAGFDILNPVQCSATGMIPEQLKAEFGNDIVFWGGGVDTQKTLPFGTPAEVYREVRERVEIFFSDRTGFVFNAIHNIQSNVPIENVQAMLKAIQDVRSQSTAATHEIKDMSARRSRDTAGEVQA